MFEKDSTDLIIAYEDPRLYQQEICANVIKSLKPYKNLLIFHVEKPLLAKYQRNTEPKSSHQFGKYLNGPQICSYTYARDRKRDQSRFNYIRNLIEKSTVENENVLAIFPVDDIQSICFELERNFFIYD